VNAIFDRLKHAWNAFKSSGTQDFVQDFGYSSSISQATQYHTSAFTRSLIFAICNRMAIDVASYDIQHVRVNPETKRYEETMKSGLNNCLTVEANIDQTGRAFLQDAVMSMFDEGHVAIVPTETDYDPRNTDSYRINTLRTAKIIEWYPQHVKVDIYNDKKGIREWLILPKNMVAIVENPLYAVMNEPNSTLKRLVKKLNQMDAIDDISSSGKLDIIIQLPYVIKTELRQKQAEERRKAIEQQLAGSKYGIAYIDGTERITQLNRASENNLLAQVTYLTQMLYGQLGISEEIFTGKADEKAMLNYYDRTIEPIATALIDEMNRKFLTKTARTQGQTIMGFRDVFKLVPANEIAEIADSFTRNEILTSNEIRSILGMKPSTDPKADELRNANMPQEDMGMMVDENQNGIDDAEEGLESEDPGIPMEEVQRMMEEMSAEYEATIEEILSSVETEINNSLNEEEMTDLENTVVGDLK